MRTRRRWTGHPRNTVHAPCFPAPQFASTAVCCWRRHQCIKPKNRRAGGRPLVRRTVSDSINSSGYDSRPRPTTTVAILTLYLLSSILYHIYAVNIDSSRLIRVLGLLFLSLVGLSTRHYPCWTRAYAGQAQSFAQHHSSREQALVPSMATSTPPYTSETPSFKPRPATTQRR